MSYQTALWPLQVAVYNRLSSDPNISELVTGVFDHTPENQLFPYVVIGQPEVNPHDTKNTFGEEIGLVIHVWSIYEGKKEAYDILNACLQALSYRLDVTDFKLIKTERRGLQVFDDIDPDIKHGVLRMQYTIINI